MSHSTGKLFSAKKGNKVNGPSPDSGYLSPMPNDVLWSPGGGYLSPASNHVPWSPESGYLSPLADDLNGLTLEPQSQTKTKAFEIQAGVMPVKNQNSPHNKVSATFKNVENGKEVKKLVDGGVMVGRVTVEPLGKSSEKPVDDQFKIWVQNVMYKGSTYELLVRKRDKVSKLKEVLSQRDVNRVPAQDIVLTYMGKSLESGKTLGDYNMQNMSKTINGRVFMATKLNAG